MGRSGVLTESKDAQAYWRKLKQRLKAEGNETVTNCHGLKMQAADGRMRLTDVADTEQLFRLIQSTPLPMKGLVLTVCPNTRLYPITKGVSKQLLPIYDGSMGFEPISGKMLSDSERLYVLVII